MTNCKSLNSYHDVIIVCGILLFMVIIIVIIVFCPRAGLSMQTQEPRMQYCRRQVFHRNLSNQGCSFTRDLIGAVASRCFLHPTLFL